MNRLLACFIVISMLATQTAQCWASGTGTSSAEFLKLGVGARAVGMGEAYTAQADDVSALYWNPAGLAFMQQRQASFMYSQFLKDVNYQNASLGIPLENGAIGGSLTYLSYGKIAGYDVNGDSIGNQSAYDANATLGAAWLGSIWSLGVNTKMIQEKLSDEKATGFAFDAGGTLIYPQPVLGGTIRFGAVAQNLGTGLKFIDDKAPFPTEFKVGVAAVQMLRKKLNVSLDYAKPRDSDGSVRAGLEFWLFPMIALRTGYTAEKQEGSGVRAGLGLRIKGVSFDYAYAGYGDLGMSHRYELSFKFGEPRPLLTPEERRIYTQAKAAMRAGRYDQAVLLFDSLITLVPNFKPARRAIQVAMANMEDQQKNQFARQGQRYDPSLTETSKKQPVLTELDDLEALLGESQPKAAQAPAAR